MPGVTKSFQTREPGYYSEEKPPGSFWNRIAGYIREDPKKLIAKSKNALAFSEMLNITPSQAYDYHDVIEEHIFGERGPTTVELIEGLATLPTTAYLFMSPLKFLLGAGAFTAIHEAESAAVSLKTDQKYQVFQNRISILVQTYFYQLMPRQNAYSMTVAFSLLSSQYVDFRTYQPALIN